MCLGKDKVGLWKKEIMIFMRCKGDFVGVYYGILQGLRCFGVEK